MALNPSAVRYIKLGEKDRWAKASLERGEVQLGHSSIPHDLCLTGDWDAVMDRYIKSGKTVGKARDFTREIREFYTLDRETLWFTFHKGHLWWTFAEAEVNAIPEADDQGARMRRAVGGWRNTDTAGKPLRMDGLSSRLTATAAYRQTLCSTKAGDYLLRRIEGGEEPIIARAKGAQDEMIKVASDMIVNLHWADFEDMVDLIFARTGWQRVTRVGGTQKDIDIEVVEPATGARAFVQVKSRAGQRELDDYLERWEAVGGYEHMFFVCHSPTSALEVEADKNVHIWTRESLADMAIRSGLYSWLIERSA
ncbi:MAG: restriction endonuclease [Rhodospirillaceae bacterium]